MLKVLTHYYCDKAGASTARHDNPVIAEVITFCPDKYTPKAIVKANGFLCQISVDGLKVYEEE